MEIKYVVTTLDELLNALGKSAEERSDNVHEEDNNGSKEEISEKVDDVGKEEKTPENEDNEYKEEELPRMTQEGKCTVPHRPLL